METASLLVCYFLSLAAAVVAAAVLAAGVWLAAVLVIVMVAMDGGVEAQRPGQQGAYRLVRTAADAAVEFDARLGQGRLGAAADAATDQNIRPQRAEDAGQGAVAAAIGVHHLGGEDLPVLHIVDLKLLRVAKVLKDLSVFVSDRNSHHVFSFRFRILLIDLLFIAIPAPMESAASVAEPIVSALDSQGQPIHQRIRQLFPDVGI